MKKGLTARELSLIGIFTALTAVFAQIAIPLPMTPVPLSFGLVAVYMAGIFLKPRHAILTQIVYLLLGAAGAPVFAGLRGGVMALLGPTGGYLIVYPIMAGIVAFALNGRNALARETRGKRRRLFFRATVALCAAHMVIYLGGTTWLWLSATSGVSFQDALASGVYPFILLDVVKIAFCVAVVVPLRSRFRSLRLLMLDGDGVDKATMGNEVEAQ